ncbi:MAG: DUF5605 domain-containing protein [Treponema sp.]|jgi:hypothetical protein|nr:DUF5605 domain-containing protein [Treponema sp.]
MTDFSYPARVERWGVFEVSCPGLTGKTPFTDYTIQGVFTGKNETLRIDGFYDGNGTYKLRFMPSFTGDYAFEVSGSFSDTAYSGHFRVEPAGRDNHGPVRVANTFHFAYEDGAPYYPLGTTCYVWELQSDELQKQTLETLKKGPFNKIRFCIFPKHYDYNLKEPRSYPYSGKPMDSSVLTKENFLRYMGNPPGNEWDFKCFNVEHFQHIEKCIAALGDLGIEADLIVMHPYDRWGFSMMDAECDDLYWKYVIARFAAYRNVWWSLDNEYDLMPQKKTGDWERYASILREKDPYKHLRSIHNCRSFYDYSRPWITHCCIQRQDLYKCAELVQEYRERYGKPVVLDEIAYEGNIQHGWGNISGQELTRRFWEAACRGGYAGHGETFTHPGDILWWSHGGELHGESPARLAFLRRMLNETPGLGLAPMRGNWDETAAAVEQPFGDSGYYLFYYSFMRPAFRDFHFDNKNEYHVEVIDTWNMTIEDRGYCKGTFRVALPGREYMAVRIRRKGNHG